MTTEQKQKITVMRGQGLGYGAIADRLEISVNTIKSYCRRYGLTGKGGTTSAVPGFCQNCGKNMSAISKHARRKFCNDDCRREWWRRNEFMKNKAAYYSLTCACCGHEFQSYGNNKRKYCNHACYINHRFTRGRGYDARTV